MFYLGIIFYILFSGTGEKHFAPNGIGVGQVVLTVFFLHGWAIDSFNAVVPGGWSIGNEVMFYLLFIFLAAYISSLKRAAVLFVCAVVLSRASFVYVPKLLAGNPLALEYAAFLFTTQFVAFAGGILIFYLQKHIRLTQIAGTPLATKLCVVIAAIIFAMAISNKPMPTNYLLAVIMFVPFVLLVGLSNTRVLVNRAMIYLGKISFSIYIVHFAVIELIKPFLYLLAQTASQPFALAVTYVSVFFVASVISTITYRFIELPGVEIGRSLTVKI